MSLKERKPKAKSKGVMEKECGQAGNGIYLLMKGACGKKLDIEEAYRCTGCGKWFHLDCIFNHFEQEEKASRAHHSLKKIKEFIQKIQDECEMGLERKKPSISF